MEADALPFITEKTLAENQEYSMMMRCPNETCQSRALVVEAETETVVHFTEKGRIGEVEHGEWYINADSDVSCERCHWVGTYAHCIEVTEA